jgi:hypothetical protein
MLWSFGDNQLISVEKRNSTLSFKANYQLSSKDRRTGYATSKLAKASPSADIKVSNLAQASSLLYHAYISSPLYGTNGSLPVVNWVGESPNQSTLQARRLIGQDFISILLPRLQSRGLIPSSWDHITVVQPVYQFPSPPHVGYAAIRSLPIQLW